MRAHIYTFISAICLSACLYAAPKAKTSFAIITDSRTYEACSGEIQAYADVLESEGLKTYVLREDWENPEQVKESILKLYRKKPVLEGVVFIGDIPVVMVRGAQFMTTAFKMNEDVYPFFDSSVASDRFYDDFDLSFEFIRKDGEHKDVFYYQLTSDGTMQLHSDIYSARMKVPEVMDGDKYEIMRSYLRKVVDAHKEQGNTLDRMTYFAGNGYNSDCLTIWRQKPVVFSEAFPYAFRNASGQRFLNFREQPQMKWRLFNEMQRPGTDIMLFSEHGSPDTQYINGYGKASNYKESLDQLLRYLAKSYKKYKGTEDEEPFLHEVDSLYHIGKAAFCDSALVAYAAADKEEHEKANISVEDLKKVDTDARVVILNACYNGSFHNPEGYVAGCHVFGNGKCIVAQGNTVNVLQDKWEDELIGYLSIGERVGMWQRELCYLESHLIGDPTFRFAPHDAEEESFCASLHNDLIRNQSKASVWERYLNDESPLARSAGIVHLGYLGKEACSDKAYELFRNDPSWMVRIHALNVLWKCADGNTLMALRDGWDDPYELVVRTCARIADSMGSEETLPMLNAMLTYHPEMQRVAFQAKNAVNVVEGKRYLKSAGKLTDTTLKQDERISRIRSFRNYRAICAIEPMVTVVKNSDDDIAVRLAACEALGWYDSSVERGKIINSLQGFDAGDKELASMLAKTLKRLEHK